MVAAMMVAVKMAAAMMVVEMEAAMVVVEMAAAMVVVKTVALMVAVVMVVRVRVHFLADMEEWMVDLAATVEVKVVLMVVVREVVKEEAMKAENMAMEIRVVVVMVVEKETSELLSDSKYCMDSHRHPTILQHPLRLLNRC